MKIAVKEMLNRTLSDEGTLALIGIIADLISELYTSKNLFGFLSNLLDGIEIFF
jgi:hypothetical protein